MLTRREYRLGALCAIIGSILLLVGTWLHPMHADPNDPAAAFAEYAADRWWVASHLVQLAGVALMVIALLILAHELGMGGGAWPRVAAGAAVATFALAAALQAIDGIALKFMVDAWAAAPESEKQPLFFATLAVRQVEIGFAAMQAMAFGFTIILFGACLAGYRLYPAWLGGVAIAGGLATAVAGVMMACTGFSASAMAVSMPSSCVLLGWMIVLGVVFWRRGGRH